MSTHDMHGVNHFCWGLRGVYVCLRVKVFGKHRFGTQGLQDALETDLHQKPYLEPILSNQKLGTYFV